MIPRVLTKEVFCWVFSINGETPILRQTLWEKYVEPYEEIGIGLEDWRSYAKGIPGPQCQKIIEVHQITDMEIKEALDCIARARREKAKKLYLKASA